MPLGELEIDFIKESFNRGLGKATALLERVTNSKEEIDFTVTRLKYIHINQLINESPPQTKLCGIQQEFSGDMHGKGIVLFSPALASKLIELLTGLNINPESVSEIESDVLTEVGNTVFNYNLLSICEATELSINTSYPAFNFLEINNFFDSQFYSHKKKVLVFETDLRFTKHNIKGSIALVLQIENMGEFERSIKSMITKLFGDAL